MKFFEKITDMKELKKAYKQWAFKLHPDMGGSEAEFKAMSAEYEVCFKDIKAGIKRETGSKNINLDDVDDGYRDVINALLNIEVNVELCGEWLWISGNTKEHRTELKDIGCKWASKKHMWYWRPACMRSSGRKGGKDMDEIRAKYGSINVRGYKPRKPELTD